LPVEVLQANGPLPQPPAAPALPAGVGSLELAHEPFLPVNDALKPLEQRIRRLEDALAQLQDPRAGEPAAAPTSTAVSAALVVPPESHAPAPAATPVVAPIPPRRAPLLGVPSAGQHLWLLREAVAEARAIWRMYFDPRYRLSWLGRIVPAVLACAILLSGFWNPLAHLPVVGGLLDKLVDLVLAFVLFKVLSHEARRYRETAPDLPPSLRL
jgi:hypothetical protein